MVSLFVFIVCLFSFGKDLNRLPDSLLIKEDFVDVGESIALESINESILIDSPYLNSQNKADIDQGVDFWKEQFDSAWDNPSIGKNAFGMAKAMFYAESGGNSQEYYYLAWQLDGVIQIWQATGDNEYLEDALTIIETCIGKAKDVRGGKYKGWGVTNLKNNSYARNGVPLYESYLFRYVATLLRVMYQSPNLRATERYQERYEAILEFTKKHIWEKWYTKSSNQSDIYRVNAHMTSHWARIAMELHIITGENIYKEVFDNISFAGLPIYPGASLRNKLKSNPNFPTAYTWSSKWEGSRVQDTSHGADIVSFWTTAYENGMYWNAEDIEALLNTLNKVVWTEDSPLKFTANVDGSGGSNEWDAGFHNFITLGRFSEEVQNRIELHYSTKTVRYKTSEAFGIAAPEQKDTQRWETRLS
ncbi:hypothetical protein [Flagellimonas sp.]|uniref:hypothetical protein n=1 Tax=Flagellimonas sp. TaxID=2058762 RepID=UPI003B5B8FEC